MEKPVITIEGEPDVTYLQEALARAGIVSTEDKLDIEELTGGRTGARVDKLILGDCAYVLKRVPVSNWRQEAMKSPGEGPLWLSGALDAEQVPPSLQCPTIDVVQHGPSDAWWLLMRDVSAGIAERGQFGEVETRILWSAMAKLHAQYWGKSEELQKLPLAQLKATTDVLAEPGYSAASNHFREPWVADVVEEFMPLRVLQPIFLELLSSTDLEFYLEMVKTRDWHKGLDEAQSTFLHGDLRRANISFLESKAILFDWEFAAAGPAACDLQWNSFLTFWAYSPEDGKEPWERDHLREFYLAELETALGYSIDRDEFQRLCELAWLRVMSQLGFCFADANLDDTDERDLVKNRINVAIQNCRRTLGD